MRARRGRRKASDRHRHERPMEERAAAAAAAVEKKRPQLLRACRRPRRGESTGGRGKISAAADASEMGAKPLDMKPTHSRQVHPRPN